MPLRTRRQAKQETPSSSSSDEETSPQQPQTEQIQSEEPIQLADAQAHSHEPSQHGRSSDFQPPLSNVLRSPSKTSVTKLPSQPPDSAEPPIRASTQAERRTTPRKTVQWPQGREYGVEALFSPPMSKQTEKSSQSNMDLPSRNRDPFPADLDNEDFSQDVYLNLPVGSFASEEDSPPRGSSSEEDDRRRLRASPRGSPSRQQPYSMHPYPAFPYYQQSRKAQQAQQLYYPPQGQGQVHPGQSIPASSHSQGQSQKSFNYGYPPPQYYGTSHPPSDRHTWSTPPDFDESFSPPETKLRGSPTRQEKDSNIKLGTPEKEPASKMGGNVFRSPPSLDTRYKRSPLRASPYAGTYGSFGMIDTPTGGGTLAQDFSPMGPSFAGLGDEPLPLHESNAEELGGPSMQQRPPPDHSPFSFINEFSPIAVGLQGVPRSPMQPGGERRGQSAPPHARQELAQADQSSGQKSVQIRRSPLAPPSETRPRKLWQEPGSAPPSAMRMELGQSLHRTQRTLEGINTMMRNAQAQQPRPQAARPSYSQPPMHHAQYFRSSIATPMKTGSQGQMPPNSGQGLCYAPVGSASKQSTSFPPSAAKSNSTAGGKENPSVRAVQMRRSPCNCKRSKCLKLYCECFSQKLYCEDCNCTDCRNIPAYESIREEAIKSTKTKNPKAFEPRIVQDVALEGPAEQAGAAGHNMGCKCKRSECLKKYCECFQAGVLCNPKCKCSGCMNRAGSQKLIDKRRKMKDTRGAEYAMRVAEETWKGQPSQRKPPAVPPRRVPGPSPVLTGHPPMRGLNPMLQPTPGSHGRPPPSLQQGRPMAAHPFMRAYMPPHMGGMGYSPMGSVPPITPNYADSRSMERGSFPRPPHPTATETASSQDAKRPASKITPSAGTPRTPAVRVAFDPASSRKKRKTANEEEQTLAYFGPSLPQQPKTTALAVFSFLSNDDVYKAALVCKRWSQLAMDEELWQFDVKSHKTLERS